MINRYSDGIQVMWCLHSAAAVACRLTDHLLHDAVSLLLQFINTMVIYEFTALLKVTYVMYADFLS